MAETYVDMCGCVIRHDCAHARVVGCGFCPGVKSLVEWHAYSTLTALEICYTTPT